MAHATATAIAGDRPPRNGCQNRLSFTVGRGPVPRHASIGTENGVGWRAVFAQVERSRGTGPRATVNSRLRFTVGRGTGPRRASSERKTALAGVRFSRKSGDRGGQAPALRLVKPPPFTVGRGPVPRNANGHACAHSLCRAGSPDPASSGAGAPELQSLLGP